MGRPRDFRIGVFHKISLAVVPGLGRPRFDAITSSAYVRGVLPGADGARQCDLPGGLPRPGHDRHCFVMSHAYSRIIEHFPSGGGGYLVASKAAGGEGGVVSGSALLVDYILTITVSIASGGMRWFSWRLWRGTLGNCPQSLR